MTYLSRLLLAPPNTDASISTIVFSGDALVTTMSKDQFDDLVSLAHSNHVIMRGMEVFRGLARDAQDEMRMDWAMSALEVERARIKNAKSFLSAICEAFLDEGLDVVVIKSLDHWPDIGSDLDLYTDAEPQQVAELMNKRFQARIAVPSWGDRLACKSNFLIPGLPEAVEIHIGRLGQTGEQFTLASRLIAMARDVRIEGEVFRVPSVSDRLMISTLQRMYRHFYFRLCDIVDSAGLAETGAIDYVDLQHSAEACGIWEGVATYLAIVSDYVRQFRGKGLDLPQSVSNAAQFGGDEISFGRGFLRVPILPQSARLYGMQLGGMLRQRKLQGSVRLALLPWLATAAAVGQKITGSDKGIW